MVCDLQIVKSATEPNSILCPDCGADCFYRRSLNIFDESPFLDAKTPWILMNCEICLEKEIAEEKKKKQDQLDENFLKSTPQAYRNANLEELIGFEKLVDIYHSNKNDLVFVSGPAGVGKTYALQALRRLAYSQDRPLRYVDLRRFLLDVKIQSGVGYSRTMLDVQMIADFSGAVFLDDLGAESISKVTTESLVAILCEREQWRPGLTVVASNLTISEIKSTFDDRIASRLAGGTIINITGKDKRLKGETIKNDSRQS